MDHAERTHDRRARLRRAAARSAMTASVLSLAPRLASTSARAAAPSRARRTGSPIRLSTVSSSSRSFCTWIAAPLARNVSAISLEVLHVRAERRSACRSAPARGCCGRRPARGCRRRTPPWRSDRAAPARRWCRAPPRRRAARRRSAARVRRTVASPSCRHRRSTSAKRSGWRAAMIEQRVLPARRRAQPVERADHRLLLAAQRAAGDEHRPVRATMRKKRSTRSGPRPAYGRRSERVELEAAGDDDPRRVGAERRQPPRRLLALHAEAVDVGEHAAEERPTSR